MPTGYTYPIVEKGISFKEFAMSCARAFGACIEMRDDAMDAPIPEEFKPSDYNTMRLAGAKSELARLNAMTEDQQAEFGTKTKAENVKRYRELLEREQEENLKLETVEKEVLAWVPPTLDHVGLKDFMLEQIKISKHDLHYWKGEMERAENALPSDLYRSAVEQAVRDVRHRTEGEREDRERAQSRTDWVKKLRESLK